ncbi:EAL domain-containing protein [Vibrio salinus]|uniref:EAL domain-containing protein n=1 Tax=Vibrio salinus TaxID=2899784 RepID=UPI001E5F1582|nr:EAL domain-containing protein [Vibrio salinus]MCE0495302.1 EAL domain-containing protein [Vibrio salinus]
MIFLIPRICFLSFFVVTLWWIPASYAEESPDSIVIQLRWSHQFQFAGYYAAIEKGYYQEEGLNVRLLAGNPQRQPVPETLSANAQYGVGNSEVLYQRLLGKPLVALAVIFQHSPSVLLTLKSSGIRSVHDLAGKKIMLANKNEDADFLAMFLNEGLPLSQLNIIPSTYHLDDLVTGKVDAFNSYLTNEPYFLKRHNIAYNVIDPASHHVDFYSDIFFTTEQELHYHPARIRSMLRATLKGWHYALEHPDEIIELLKTKYKVKQTRDHLRYEANEMRKLIIPDLIQIGHMNPERWQHMANTFVVSGMVDNTNNLNGFIYHPEPDYIPDWVVSVLFFAFLMMVLAITIIFYFHRFNRRMSTAQTKLLQSEERFKALSEATYGGIIIHEQGKILECNNGLTDITGFSYSELLGSDCFKLVDPNDIKTVTDNINNGFTGNYEVTAIRKDKTRFPLSVKGKNIVYKGRSARVIEVIDITEQKKIGDQLKLAASVFTHAREGIMITQPSGIIVDVNETFTHLTGYERHEILGKHPKVLDSGRYNDGFYRELWDSLLSNRHWSGELWNKRKNGEFFAGLVTISAVLDVNGKIKNFVALFSDITPMKNHQEQLEHIAHYDTLTNLPNRMLLADRLHQAMIQSRRHSRSVAVAYLDLDGFKAINDTYGHDVGDELLVQLSALMARTLRAGDTLARIGGDEFVAVLVDIEKYSDCELILKRLLQAAMRAVSVRRYTLQVSTSIGVTLYPQDGVDADQLMRHADQAMYIAKQMGKNRYHLFDIHKDKFIQTQHETIEHVQKGLERCEFALHYQPKVNMKTGELFGLEALVRWQHPERGLVYPGEFLPVVENHPISLQLGDWVLDTVLKQISDWKSVGLDITVSVNIDAFQIQQKSFVQKLSAALDSYPMVSPSSLRLEILETSALGDLSEVLAIMRECIRIGVHFSLDDFGTGFSSLTYLKRLPVDLLKIDQSFIRDVLDDADDREIVRGIIGLASAFNLEVMAEGVESIEHGTQLLKMGCHLAQGFGIAKPMPAEIIPEWITDWTPDPEWTQKSVYNQEN